MMVATDPKPIPPLDGGRDVATLEVFEESASNDAELDAPSFEPVYCVCRGPDDGKLMVQCDKCMEWFHATCVRLSPKSDLSHWLCPLCSDSRSGLKSPSPSPPPRPLLKSEPVLIPVKSNNTTPRAKSSLSGEIAGSDNTSKSQKIGARRISVKISPINKIVKSMSTPEVPLSERIHQDRISCRGALSKIVPDALAFNIEQAVLPKELTADSVKNYKMKIREIILNLKSNPELMESVVEGSVTPTQLATKDAASLAAPDLIAARTEQRQLSIISRLVNPTEVEDPKPAVVSSSAPDNSADIVLPDVVTATDPVEPVPRPPALKLSSINEASDSDVSVPIAFEAYQKEHMDSFTEIVKPPPSDWAGTLAMSPSDEAFSLHGSIVEPELKSDRKRLSKLPNSLHIHGRVEPSSVHKFLLQVHNITRGMKGSERLNHKRSALVKFHVDDDNASSCSKFIKNYTDRNRIPVIDNTELGILLYFVSPVFDGNAQWTSVLQELFGEPSPPERCTLWAIAIITAESKLNNKGSSSTSKHHHHSRRSHKDHARAAPAALPPPSNAPTPMQIEHLEHALAEVDSLTNLVDPRLDPNSWRSHDSFVGAPPGPLAAFGLDPRQAPAAYRARPPLPPPDSEFIHPDRAARMYGDPHDRYRPAPRYHHHPDDRIAVQDPYYWAPPPPPPVDRYGPVRGPAGPAWPQQPYQRPPIPMGRIPLVDDARPPIGSGDGQRGRRRGRDKGRSRGRFPPDTRQ